MMWLRKYSAALGMIIVGICALVGSGVQVWQTTHFLSQATSTQGLVVKASGHPVIRFSTVAGKPVQFVQNGFLTRPLGASVPVVYSAHDPAGTARAATFWTLWGPALWLLPMGLGFTILPLLGAEVTWRSGRF
ncbi:DUF3592 domain-containing protein [Deinococcus sp. UYEF24]